MLKVKEFYQYPKPDSDGNNETDVFSREPFIVRFHSPTTCMMKHHEAHVEPFTSVLRISSSDLMPV